MLKLGFKLFWSGIPVCLVLGVKLFAIGVCLGGIKGTGYKFWLFLPNQLMQKITETKNGIAGIAITIGDGFIVNIPGAENINA